MCELPTRLRTDNRRASLHQSPGYSRRSGATYVIVLMASLIVASMTLASVETMRWFARDRADSRNTALLHTAVESCLDLALVQINNDPTWRVNFTSNVDTSPLQINGVSCVYRLIDVDDGDLADNEYDNADLLVTARLGEYCEAWRCTLEPYGDPLDCLQYSIATDMKVEVGNLSVTATDQAVASNNNISTLGSGFLTGDSFAVGSISGNTYGTTNSLATNVSIPDKECLDFYIQNSVAIDINSLPQDDSVHVIENQLLSATSNTLSGQLSPEGIYFIDCGDKEIRISNSRLRCTLVLKKPKKNSEVSGSVFWEAAQANYPALLVEGEMEFNLSRSPLREADAEINFNPPSTPYLGSSDANTSTIYPSVLRGLFFASKKIEAKNLGGKNHFVGQLITHDQVVTTGDLFISYRDIFFRDPPPGFRSGNRVRILAGTVHRVAQP